MAAGFPSTVAPIVQNGLVPVFVDVRSGRLQRRPGPAARRGRASARARSCSRTRWASRSTWTRSCELVEEHDLWLVEDNCDALGSRYRDRLTGHLRPPRDVFVLSGAPHHHRRGRHGRHRRRGARPDRPLGPRLGPRLLLRRRREQHLRQALLAAVREPASRLRPQVRLQPSRLQPQGDGHAGGDRLRPASPPRRVRRRAQARTTRGFARRSAPTRTGWSSPMRRRTPTRRGSAS